MVSERGDAAAEVEERVARVGGGGREVQGGFARRIGGESGVLLDGREDLCGVRGGRQEPRLGCGDRARARSVQFGRDRVPLDRCRQAVVGRCLLRQDSRPATLNSGSGLDDRAVPLLNRAGGADRELDGLKASGERGDPADAREAADLAKDADRRAERRQEELDGLLPRIDRVREQMDAVRDGLVDVLVLAEVVDPDAPDLDGAVDLRERVAAEARLELRDVLTEPSELAGGAFRERLCLTREAPLDFLENLDLRRLRVERLRRRERRPELLLRRLIELDARTDELGVFLLQLVDVRRDWRDDDAEPADRRDRALLRAGEQLRGLRQPDMPRPRDVLRAPE